MICILSFYYCPLRFSLFCLYVYFVMSINVEFKKKSPKRKSVVQPKTVHRGSQLLKEVSCSVQEPDGCLEEAVLEPGAHGFQAPVPS